MGYIDRMTDEADNALQKCFFTCIQCCLRCVECCCRWIGRNALVWQSIYGDAFCESAWSSFGVMWANLDKVAMMTMVSGIVIVIGKLSICFGATAISGMILIYMEPFASELNSV